MYIFWIAGSTADYWNGSSNPTTTGNVTGVNSAPTTAYYDDQVTIILGLNDKRGFY